MTSSQNLPSRVELESVLEFYNSGNYSAAERRALSLTGLYPGAGHLWKLLWASLEKQGKKSLSALTKAAELLPKDADVHNNMGVSLKSLGRLDDALDCYQRAISIDNDYAEAHSNMGDLLDEMGRHSEAIVCCERAIQLKPQFAEAHSNLAKLYLKQRDAIKAKHHYQKALNVSPTLISAQQGMNKVLSKSVPRWHVPMMNEGSRNEAYFAALKSAVTNGLDVLEIGTGSGLLAMMAAKAGAKRVTTCEVEPLLADTAKQIITDNGYTGEISVVQKRSLDLNLGEDLPEKANILVSEIFSSELLAEGVLQSIEDAKERLLKPGANIIPKVGSIMVGLFGGQDIDRNLFVEDSLGFDLQHFNSIVPRKQTVLRHDLNIEMQSDDFEAFRFEFEVEKEFPAEAKELQLTATKDGRCSGIIQWIRLELDDEIEYQNHPRDKSPVSNWQCCAYLFSQPIDLQAGQTVIISASHNRSTPWFTLMGVEPWTSE